jgi:hypothetical protein
LGLGKFPDLKGAVPDMGTNPVPDGGSTTDVKLFFTLGAGLGEWVDLGISSSRGLYSNVQLIRAGGWSLSVSPAYYRATEDSDADGDTTWIRASNRNLTGLVAFQTGEAEGVSAEIYGGSGVNWYKVEIRDRWRSHSGTSPTLLAGVAIDGATLDLWGQPGEESESTAPGDDGLRICLELAGSWIRQRTGRRDFVVVGRAQLAFRSLTAW